MSVKKKAAVKKLTKSFEESLWETATKLRGSVESSEYKHVVLSLIFLKFVSDKFEERRAELIADGKEDYLDMLEFYTMQNVFYLPETSRWSYIQQHAKQGDIAIKIDSALTAVEKSNDSLKGALPDNDFSCLGLDASKLSALIDAINNIDTVSDKEEDTIEVKNKNDEGRKRSQGAHEKVRAAHHSTVRKLAQINGSSDSWQAVTPLGNICRGELSRGSSRKEQSRVHREMRRLASGAGRVRVLVGTPHRGRNRASSQVADELSMMNSEVSETHHSELSIHHSSACADVPGYCKSATLEDMRKHDYVLTPGRYVGAAALEDDGIPFETKMTELSQTRYGQMEESANLDDVIRKNLEGLGYEK